MSLRWKIRLAFLPFVILGGAAVAGALVLDRGALRSGAASVWAALAFGLGGSLLTIAVLCAWVLERSVRERIERLRGHALQAARRAGVPPPTVLHEGGETSQVCRAIEALADRLLETRRQVEAHAERVEYEIREKTKDLERMLGELRNASAFKSRFLASLSHEMRTPLNSILGYTEILRDPDTLEADRAFALQVVDRNARHLLGLVNDVLDLSRIEAGQMEIDLEECVLTRILHDVISVMWVRARRKSLNLEEVFQTPVPERIVSDPSRLRQVLINLLGNAVKFTAQGTIRLVVALEPPEAGPRRTLRFRVEDTGIGIPPGELESIFLPFNRGGRLEAHRQEGTGLGLSISREIARLLGGDITVESEVGQGSAFTFELRCDVPEGVRWLKEPSRAILDGRTSAAEPLDRLHGRVLVAEDSADNRRLLRYHLEAAGLEVEEAANGREAVDLVHSGPFDLVLLDVDMPCLDGFAALKEMRALGLNVPCIALTGHAMKGDRERCLAAGFDHYVAKPVSRRALVKTLARYLPAQEEGTEPMRPRPLACEGLPRELVAEFLAHLREEAESLASAHKKGDLAALAALAHKIKGTAGGYGFLEVSEAARLIEKALAEGGPSVVADRVEAFRTLVLEVSRGAVRESSGG